MTTTVYQGDEPLAVVIKDGTTYEFSQGDLNIYDCVEDCLKGKSPINSYELKPMYMVDKGDDYEKNC